MVGSAARLNAASPKRENALRRDITLDVICSLITISLRSAIVVTSETIPSSLTAAFRAVQLYSTKSKASLYCSYVYSLIPMDTVQSAKYVAAVSQLSQNPHDDGELTLTAIRVHAEAKRARRRSKEAIMAEWDCNGFPARLRRLPGQLF